METLTVLTGLGLSLGLIDGKPIVQAANALGFGETAFGFSVTTAQAGGLPASTYQEPAVSPDVPALLSCFTVTEERLLALRLTGREDRARRCRLAPGTTQRQV